MIKEVLRISRESTSQRKETVTMGKEDGPG